MVRFDSGLDVWCAELCRHLSFMIESNCKGLFDEI